MKLIIDQMSKGARSDNRLSETGLFGPVADDFRESKGIGTGNAPTHRATFAPLAEALHASQRAVAECEQDAM
jgi:hypothetical protein